MSGGPPPASMDAMMALSREEAMEIDDIRWGEDLSIKKVTRHMATLLSNELTWKGRENSQSLRGLWYSGVKQVYQNLWPERWEPEYYSESPSRRFSQKLSEHISDMVKEGELTYRDLNVVDDSRDRDIADSDFDVEHDKILFVEKEAKYRQLKPLADVFELSLVSGGGWQATALIEDLANILDPSETYTIFVLTDYDPTGYQIADDFGRRARSLGLNVDEVRRIGIEPEQIPDGDLEAERFEVPVEDENDEAWLRDNGIPDEHGRPKYGLELEAIGDRDTQARDFRGVVAKALDPELRKHRRRERDLSIETANTVGRGVDDLVERMTDRLVTRLKTYAIEDLRGHEAVNSLDYREPDDTVTANVDMDERVTSADNRIPEPLEWQAYYQGAVDPETNDDGEVLSPRPSRAWQVNRLQRLLVQEMMDDDGDIDVMELLDVDI